MSYIGTSPVGGIIRSEFFSGDGSTTTFNLTYSYGSEASLLVFISGVKQKTNTYSLLSGQLIFSSPPTSGSSNIEVIYLSGSILTALASVANTNIIGLIKSTQIANVANTQIAGNIISSQITSVANTPITGNIISSQITSVANTQITGNIVASQITSIANTQITGLITATQIASTVAVNRIINGAMMIDQRNNGAEVNPAVASTYYLDRWSVTSSAASKFKIGQNAGSVTPPANFINYLGCTSLSAYTVGTSEIFGIRQIIEGYNIADLNWGTANAATVTLSFWVRSSLTGTFGGALKNSAGSRSYPFSYTISSANTWEQKSITISGDTSGTWLTTNGIGLQVFFSIGTGATVSGSAGAWSSTNYSSATGATSVVGTNGATFYITGVQLEKSSTASNFEFRNYITELALCQRYYETGYNAMWGRSENPMGCWTAFKVTKRAAPTMAYSNFTQLGGAGTCSLNGTSYGPTTDGFLVTCSTTVGTNQGFSVQWTSDIEL